MVDVNFGKFKAYYMGLFFILLMRQLNDYVKCTVSHGCLMGFLGFHVVGVGCISEICWATGFNLLL